MEKQLHLSMISVVLEHAKVDPTILIGGFVDYLKGNAKLGKSDYLVAEADESDGSFLKFYPKIAVVTNIEDDHMDIMVLWKTSSKHLSNLYRI